jgi:putative DNA primase/helicase
LRADGTLCEREGFDPASGLLCKWDGMRFPPVPAKPNKDDALRALDELCQPIAEFPFVAKIDKAVSLSATLTALARRSIDFAPIHAYTAPTYGTGKGLLVDVTVAIASGRPAAPLAQSRNEEETTKTLNAALIEGDPYVSLDNCAHVLEGGTILTIAVRQPLLKVRVLGISHNVEIPNSAMFFANGNNLQIAADLTRRTLLCHLDAKMERPETREFKNYQLLDAVIAGRGQLVAAGLTILRAWQLARPNVSLKLEPLDFVAWSQTVREALVWLDCGDPGESMRELRKADPQRASFLAVLMQWHAILGERPVMVREVIEAAFVRIVSNPDFQNALLAVAEARRGGVISPDRLGRWLARNEGAIANSLKFVRAGISPLKVPLWKIAPA